MPERPRRLGKNPWGARFGDSNRAVLEVWMDPDGHGLDHCFHPGDLPWSTDEVVEQLRCVVLDYFVDDDKRSEPAAFVMIEVDQESGGCAYGQGGDASPSAERQRYELLNEALRVLGLPRMKREGDH